MKKNIIIVTLFIVSLTIFLPSISNAQIITGSSTDETHEIGEASSPTPISDVIKSIKDERGFYKFIVPFGPFSDTFTGQVDLRTGTALIDYLRTWFKFLIGVAGVIAVAKLVFLGFQIIMKSSSINAKSEIRKELESTILSIILVAGSWIFLNTLNPALVKTSLLIPKQTTEVVIKPLEDNRATPDNEVKEGITTNGYYFVVTDTTTGQKKKEGPYQKIDECKDLLKSFKSEVSSSTKKTFSDDCYDHTNFSATDSEKEARLYLNSNSVYVNKGSCKYETQKDCTRIEGLNRSTLAKIIELAGDLGGQKDCNQSRVYEEFYCPVVITGGTEYGHGSHGMNKPDTFDLRYNSTLNSFLVRNAEVVSPSWCGNTRYLYKGYWYTDEVKCAKTQHFHVCMQVPGVSYQDNIMCGSISDAVLNNENICQNSITNDGQKVCRY